MKQEDNLFLVESFFSIQGEGKYAGTPSIFLRFGGCNLRCKGFKVKTKSPITNQILIGCDSIRAVDKKHFKQNWQRIKNKDELLNEVFKYLTKHKKCKPDLVITGGEPLLYHKNSIFLEFLDFFIKKQFKITIETNATIKIDFKKYQIYKDITFAMSVKLSNSKEDFKKRVNFEAIKQIANNSKDAFFKFVIDKSIKNNQEIEQITKDFNIPIFCMPLGSTSKELSQNDKYTANFCIKYCYNYVDRMHIRLWENEEKR